MTDAAKWPKARKGKLQTVREDVAARIESLQPFTLDNPNEHLLVMLRDLSNEDKHRSSIHVRIEPHALSRSVGMEFYRQEAAERRRPPHVRVLGQDLRDGSALLEFRSSTPFERPPEIGYQMATVPSISTPIGVRPVMTVLSNLSQFAREALTIVWRGVLPTGFEDAGPG